MANWLCPLLAQHDGLLDLHSFQADGQPFVMVGPLDNQGSIEPFGGTQQAALLSAIWIPTEYVRFLVNYGHLWIDDAAVLAGTDPDYQVDTFGMRAQIDF